MKLGVIFTGGTIGCQVAEDGYLQLPDSSTYFLLEEAKKRGILDGITVIPVSYTHLTLPTTSIV